MRIQNWLKNISNANSEDSFCVQNHAISEHNLNV